MIPELLRKEIKGSSATVSRDIPRKRKTVAVTTAMAVMDGSLMRTAHSKNVIGQVIGHLAAMGQALKKISQLPELTGSHLQIEDLLTNGKPGDHGHLNS
jgi:hypothetical protein